MQIEPLAECERVGQLPEQDAAQGEIEQYVHQPGDQEHGRARYQNGVLSGNDSVLATRVEHEGKVKKPDVENKVNHNHPTT